MTIEFQFWGYILRFTLLLMLGLCSWLQSSPSLATQPYPSTYQPAEAPKVLIRNASIYVGNGELLENTDLFMAGGVVSAIGQELSAEADEVIDASGQFVSPGIIDVHSHLGDYPSPSYPAHSDGNEATSPVTAEVWAEHSVWPQDPQFPLALAGGVTTLQVLPGSANLFGGRSVTLKNVSSRTVQGMKFPGAPYGLKMACGENPKRVYGEGKDVSPATRMGNFAGYRQTWIKAHAYRDAWSEYEKKRIAFENGDAEEAPQAPERDLQMETLVGVLNREILIHNHCYRADEMANIMDLSREFGYHVTAFHHAVESYKIADLLAENGTCSAMWADWWRFKLESFDGIPENVPMVHAAGACAIVHSDSAVDIQRLNQEAAKALAAGQRMGLDISRADAMAWITLNAAKALGVDDVTGSLEVGKMADVVLWDKDPFSVYARARQVYIDGLLLFDLETGLRPITDYELGHRRGEVW